MTTTTMEQQLTSLVREVEYLRTRLDRIDPIPSHNNNQSQGETDEDMIALLDEMKAWDRASDEDFDAFCKKHKL
jgi:hypothetical protein